MNYSFLCNNILDNLSENIFVKDVNSDYLYCNAAYAALLGIEAASIVGRNDFDFFPEEIASKYRNDDREMLELDRAIELDEPIVVEGRRRMIRTVKRPLYVEGKRVGILGAFLDITDLHDREVHLRELKLGLSEAQRLAHIGHWELDALKHTLYWSDEVYRIFGLEPQEFGATYEAFLSHVHPDDAARVNEAYASSVLRREDYRIVHRIVRRDQGVRWVEERCSHDFDLHGTLLRSVGTVHDITEQKQAQENFVLTAKVVENTTDGVMITDADLKIVYVNPALEAISGYAGGEMIGALPSMLSSGWHDAVFYETMWKAVNATGQWHGEIRDRKKNGELYVAELSIFALKDAEGRVTNYIAITDDITEKKEKEALIHNLAYFDSLTKLPNRVLFREKFEQAVLRAQRQQSQCALIFFDLDNFKNINDTLGHMVGDRLLIAAGKRIGKIVRSDETLCRLGGDEFTIIVENFNSAVGLAHVAERIIRTLALPFHIDNSELYIGCSIGISIFPEDGRDCDTLIKAADTAMYYVKDRGKNHYQFFTETLNMMTTERLKIENELRQATARNEMYLVYQPKIDLRDGKVYGMEALLRWQHPEMGNVPPDRFIAVAEETGQINQIGSWALIRALHDAHSLHRMGYDDLVVSVNVSSVQLRQEHFESVLLSAMLHAEIDRSKVEIEITESSLMEHVDEVMEKLQSITRHGARLSIDDFGTGYSSLSYLKKLPLQTLKIDRSFIRDIDTDADDRSITSAIISLAGNLGMEVVAEGTETAEQIEVLQELGCHRVQGYYFARPMPYDAFCKWLRERP